MAPVDLAVDRDLSANAVLRPWLRRWLSVVICEVAALGAVSLLRPEWYRATAYDFARDLFPLEWWGVIWTSIAAVMAGALIWGARFHPGVRLALAAHGVVQVIWGSSILVLTFSGSYGAFAGAVQWWIVGGISLAFAGSPLTIHRDALTRG